MKRYYFTRRCGLKIKTAKKILQVDVAQAVRRGWAAHCWTSPRCQLAWATPYKRGTVASNNLWDTIGFNWLIFLGLVCPRVPVHVRQGRVFGSSCRYWGGACGSVFVHCANAPSVISIAVLIKTSFRFTKSSTMTCCNDYHFVRSSEKTQSQSFSLSICQPCLVERDFAINWCPSKSLSMFVNVCNFSGGSVGAEFPE